MEIIALQDIKKNMSGLLIDLKDQYGPTTVSFLLRTKQSTLSRIIDEKEYPIDDISGLGKSGNFNLGTVFYFGVDSECVIRFINNEKEIFPSRYKKAAFTKRRVTQNLLKALEKIYGPQMVQSALSTMQTTPDTFADHNLEQTISTIFNSDLLAFLEQEQCIKDMAGLGAVAAHEYAGSPFGDSFLQMSYKDIFAKLGEEIFNHVEKSHRYRITKLTSSCAIIEKTLSEEMKEILKVTSYSNYQMSQYIGGCAAGIPMLAGKRPASIQVTKFAGAGALCEYTLEF